MAAASRNCVFVIHGTVTKECSRLPLSPPDRRFLFFNFTDCKVRMDTQLSFFFFFSLPVVAIVNVSPFSFFLTLPFHQIRLHYL